MVFLFSDIPNPTEHHRRSLTETSPTKWLIDFNQSQYGDVWALYYVWYANTWRTWAIGVPSQCFDYHSNPKSRAHGTYRLKPCCQPRGVPIRFRASPARCPRCFTFNSHQCLGYWYRYNHRCRVHFSFAHQYSCGAVNDCDTWIEGGHEIAPRNIT